MDKLGRNTREIKVNMSTCSFTDNGKDVGAIVWLEYSLRV
jgi:hypothetical protein